MAEAGWNVSFVDISGAASRQVATLAHNRRLPITVHRVDAASFDLKPSFFELIVLFYHFDRLLFPRFRESLKPGGMIVSKLRARSEQEEMPARLDRHVLWDNQVLSLLEGLTYSCTVNGHFQDLLLLKSLQSNECNEAGQPYLRIANVIEIPVILMNCATRDSECPPGNSLYRVYGRQVFTDALACR